MTAIQVAMFTTRRQDGRLVSRPMATQTQAEGADLWFVTDRETHKHRRSRARPSRSTWPTTATAAASGSRSAVSRGNVNDRKLIRDLYRPDWKMWFGDEGGERNGGPDDPRLALIMVEVESVTYMKVDKPKPVVLFELAKGFLTGTQPEIADVREVSGDEFRRPSAGR